MSQPQSQHTWESHEFLASIACGPERRSKVGRPCKKGRRRLSGRTLGPGWTQFPDPPQQSPRPQRSAPARLPDLGHFRWGTPLHKPASIPPLLPSHYLEQANHGRRLPLQRQGQGRARHRRWPRCRRDGECPYQGGLQSSTPSDWGVGTLTPSGCSERPSPYCTRADARSPRPTSPTAPRSIFRRATPRRATPPLPSSPPRAPASALPSPAT